MRKPSSSLQTRIMTITQRVLVCFSLLRACGTITPLSNIDLSTETLDPLTTGFMITGNAGGDAFGRSVSSAGDIDNDGYDDIIVGAWYKNNDRGAAYVIYGGEKSTTTDIPLSTQTLDPQSTGFMITGDATKDYLGASVSAAGDVNKDGFDDIIVGAHRKNNYRGAAYVIYGGPKSSMTNIVLSTQTLDPQNTGFMITGNADDDYFGGSVGPAGDINNDGYDDIIIGAYKKNNNRGAAYVIYGGEKAIMTDITLSTQTLDPQSTGFVITGNDGGDYLGDSVGPAGDIDKDGYDDIIVGAWGKNSNQGAVYVIYGGEKSAMANRVLNTQTLDPQSTGFMITGNAADDRFGNSVSTAGDVNNDGYADIIVGARGKDTQQGAVYVIYGGPKFKMANIALSTQTLDPQNTGFMITGSAPSDNFGISVSTAGDINNDGYDDIVIGAYGKNHYRGAAYVIYGKDKSTTTNILLSQTLDPLTIGFMITEAALDDYYGSSVSAAGDVDKDGYDDIIVGAYGKNGFRGEASVIFGGYACPMCSSCPTNCKQCSSASTCNECKSSYLLYQSQCLDSCPASTFSFSNKCEDCPSHCSSCTSKERCQTCDQGYFLSNSVCDLLPSSFSSSPSSSHEAQEKATQVISSSSKGVGSAICLGSATPPVALIVSKTVQNTRYLNLSVTNDLAEIYQTWDTDLISWDVPNVLSSEDRFKTAPSLFARYGINSPFLANFWPTLLNIVIGFTGFIVCIMVQKLLEQAKYEGWALSLVQKLIAGSFNFAIVQAYVCLDDILFYLVIDIKTNPFDTSYSWVSLISAFVFLVIGFLFVLFNFWIVKKYQYIKNNKKELEAFNERNKYWELFYSDFNDNDAWSQSFFAILIIRSTFSSFIITVLYDSPLMQSASLVMLDGAIILFLYLKTPFNTLRGKLAQYYYEIITLLVHLCAFSLSLQDSFDKPSDNVRVIMSTGIIYLNTALIIGSIGFLFIEIYKEISQKTKKNKQYENVAIQTATEETLTETQTRINSYREAASFENFHLLPGVHQKTNIFLSDRRIESSQVLESNFNADNSALSDTSRSLRINQQRELTLTPILIRHKRQIQPRQQKNSSVIESYTLESDRFENI